MKSARSGNAQLLPLIVADIFQLAGAFRDAGETIAGTVQQTQARWHVLSAASAEPVTVPQIARRLGVTRQGVQRLANALVADRSAAFRANPDHQGSPHLVLTDKGRTALQALTEAASRRNAAIASRLGGDELSGVHDGLRRLIAAIEQSAADPHRSRKEN